jgi:hypothetical protein
MEGANNGTTFTDEAGLTLTPSANYVTSTTQAKFGSSSGYFPGTSSDALMLPSSSALSLPGDFTIEFWLYSASANPDAVIIGSNYGGGGSNQQLRLNRDGTGYMSIYPCGDTSVTVSISANAWHHFVVTRVGTTVRYYMNGNQLGSNVSCGTEFNFSGGAVGALRGYNHSGWFNGYLDDVRITKGVARYTGTTYVVPSAQFPGN